jgi:hypothetical protein
VSIDGAIAAAATEMIDDIRRRNAEATAAAAAVPALQLPAQQVQCRAHGSCFRQSPAAQQAEVPSTQRAIAEETGTATMRIVVTVTCLAVQQDEGDEDEDGEDLDPVPMSARLRRRSAELQVVAPARGYVSAPSSPRSYAAAVTRAQVTC